MLLYGLEMQILIIFSLLPYALKTFYQGRITGTLDVLISPAERDWHACYLIFCPLRKNVF